MDNVDYKNSNELNHGDISAEEKYTEKTPKNMHQEEKSMFQYFKETFTTKKYFDFKGRAGREEFWGVILYINIFFMILMLVSAFINSPILEFSLVFIFYLIPSYAVLVRRLHDTNHSGWWVFLFLAIFSLLSFVSYMSLHGFTYTKTLLALCLIVFDIVGLGMFYLMCIPSEMKENKYGPIPEGVSFNPKDNKSMFQYFKETFTTKKYFDFKGRARRKEFWGFNLYFNLFSYLLIPLVFLLPVPIINTITLFSIPLSILCIIPFFAVLVRRLHDTNHSGWWIYLFILFFIIPAILLNGTTFKSSSTAFFILMAYFIVYIIWAITIFSFTFFKSDMKENKYGPIPEGLEE